MERIRDWITSILRLITLIGAIVIALYAFISIWDTYQIVKDCDQTIDVTINEYNMKEDTSGNEIGYPVAYYQVGETTYRYEGSTEVGTYPYDKNLGMSLKYSSRDPNVAIFDIEAKEEFYKFAAFLFLSGALAVTRVVIGIKGFYNDRDI